MNKKELFIKEVEELITQALECHEMTFMGLGADALAYFEAFKNDTKSEKPRFTDNGKLILKYMQDEHEKYNNMFKAREIAEGIFIQSRSVTGSIRKLVTDGYVEKIGADPVVYALTEEGKTTTVE